MFTSSSLKVFSTANFYKAFLIQLFLLIPFSHAIADYTVNLNEEKRAIDLVGQTGVLTIYGKLTVDNQDVSLLGFTSVIIIGPEGKIYWNDNKNLAFAAGITFDILEPGSTGGLQPTGENAAKSLTIGEITIAVSNSTANNAAYSFTEFNLSGGFSTFNITSSVSSGSTICFDTPFIVSIIPVKNPRNYDYKYEITPNAGKMTLAEEKNVSGTKSSLLIPGITTSDITYTITCNVYRAGDNDIVAKKTFTITVIGKKSYTWSGLVDETWTNPSNWLPSCSYPRNGADVIIPKVTTGLFYPKLTLNFISNNFDLQQEATIDLNGFTLTLGNSGSSNIIGSGLIRGGKTSSIIFNGKRASLNFDQLTPGSTNTLLNFTMNSSGETVTLGNSLWIVGNLNPTAGFVESGGNLTMVSTASTSSNITETNASAEVKGVVNVQVYVAGQGIVNLPSRGFVSMSSPINDRFLAAGNKTYKQMQEYIIVTGPDGVKNGFDQGGVRQPYAETITLYNEAAAPFSPSAPSIKTIHDVHVPGTGFLTFFRGSQSKDRNYAANSNKLNEPFVNPDPVTITFRGEINKSTIPVDLSYTNFGDKFDGFNLIGNPYPSAIDWNELYKTKLPGVNGVDGVVNTFTIVLPGGKQASYLDGILNNLSTTVIQPAQGFYVVTKGNKASLTFKEDVKSQTYPARLLTAPREILMSTERVAFADTDEMKVGSKRVLKLRIEDSLDSDETTLVFQEGGSMLAGYEDALYFSAGRVSLSSLSSDEKTLAINGMPELEQVEKVRLNVNAKNSGPVKLNFINLSQLDGYEVYLVDSLVSGQIIDIKSNPVYEFSIDKAKYETYGNERFTIVFKKEEIFPLTLNPFVAKKQNDEVELTWSLEASGIAKEFEIEQSSDGKAFHKIGSIRSQGNSNGTEKYYFTDTNPIMGVNYYRVRQIHLNGRMSLSAIRSIDNSSILSGISKMTVYPNPAVGIIEVKTTGHVNEPTDFNIYDMQGRMVFSTTFSGAELWRYDLSALEPTIYILEIRSSKTKKLIGRSKFVKAT